MPSASAEASQRPSGLYDRSTTGAVWPCNVLAGWPTSFQSRKVASGPPEARRRPSLLNATVRTKPLCPFIV